jgi:serine/threonine-protein kinase
VDLLLPDSAPLVFVGEAELGLGRPSLAVSPDGSWLAYIGRVGGRSQIMVRRLDRREEPVSLPGTEGAYGPVVSPDGAWIGFFVGRDLKRIAPDGRAPITLAGIPNNAGMAWTPDGTRILVSADEGTNLVWVPASGGDPVPVSQNPLNLWRPDFLPDGRHVLGMGGTDDALTVLDLVTGDRRVVTASGVFAPDEVRDSDRITGLNPHYVPSGHIAYMRWDGTLMALPFDSESLEILGQPAPVMSGVRMEAIWGAGQFDFSETGTLVYAPGDNAAVAPMVWVDLQDLKVDTLPLRPRLWGGFDLSSDGLRVLAQVASGESLDALVEIDLVSGTESSIPVSGRPTNPWWWRGDEAAVYFEMGREGTSGPTMRQPLGGGRDPDTLMVDGNASDVSPDGRWLAVSHGKQLKGIRLESTEAGQTPLSVFDQPMSWGPAFSPDGRWLAFTSSQSGMYDVYAVALPFSPGDRRIKVSQDGGLEGTWSAQGDLIYRAGRRILRVSPPRPGGTNFGNPEVLFEGPLVDVPFRGHDISPDGNRLLLILGRDADTVDHLRVVTNWFAQLRRLAPPSGG